MTKKFKILLKLIAFICLWNQRISGTILIGTFSVVESKQIQLTIYQLKYYDNLEIGQVLKICLLLTLQ